MDLRTKKKKSGMSADDIGSVVAGVGELAKDYVDKRMNESNHELKIVIDAHRHTHTELAQKIDNLVTNQAFYNEHICAANNRITVLEARVRTLASAEQARNLAEKQARCKHPILTATITDLGYVDDVRCQVCGATTPGGTTLLKRATRKVWRGIIALW